MINKTLTDAEGNTYRVVASLWLKGLTAVATLNFIILMVIVAIMIDNSRQIHDTMTFTDKATQRNNAVAEVAAFRLKANIWAYSEACDYAKKNGRECLENPKWYADPAKYPLIIDDVAGAGLFPPNK